ncbi:MAG: hypothetical protein H0U95_12080 [Bacteroidetes bacterium]|nr:hypothetical protein [Bacteroidota bacterium]
MIEGLSIPIPQRLLFIRVTVCVSLIISVLLSLHLWAGERLFPYANVFETAVIKAPYDYFFIFIFIFFIIASLFLKRHRLFIFLALLIGAGLVLIDMNRLQPWFYIYSAFLFVLMFYNGRIDDANKFTSFFIVLQLIFCSIYIFNGLSQLNSFFTETDFPELISPLQNMMSERQFLFIKKIGVFIPYMLILIGVCLLIRPIRYLAITFAVIFHVLLIIFLFPSARNQNYAIWFCNITFIPLLFLLFSGKTKQRYYSPTLLLQFPLFYLIFGLFWVMPWFNQKDLWPDHLSANFKSGNMKAVEIRFTKIVLDKLPAYVQHFSTQKDSFFVLDYNGWCRDELSANCFREPIVFNNIYQYIQAQTGATVNDLQMELKPKQKLLFKP